MFGDAHAAGTGQVSNPAPSSWMRARRACPRCPARGRDVLRARVAADVRQGLLRHPENGLLGARRQRLARRQVPRLKLHVRAGAEPERLALFAAGPPPARRSRAARREAGRAWPPFPPWLRAPSRAPLPPPAGRRRGRRRSAPATVAAAVWMTKICCLIESCRSRARRWRSSWAAASRICCSYCERRRSPGVRAPPNSVTRGSTVRPPSPSAVRAEVPQHEAHRPHPLGGPVRGTAAKRRQRPPTQWAPANHIRPRRRATGSSTFAIAAAQQPNATAMAPRNSDGVRPAPRDQGYARRPGQNGVGPVDDAGVDGVGPASLQHALSLEWRVRLRIPQGVDMGIPRSGREAGEGSNARRLPPPRRIFGGGPRTRDEEPGAGPARTFSQWFALLF